MTMVLYVVYFGTVVIAKCIPSTEMEAPSCKKKGKRTK